MHCRVGRPAHCRWDEHFLPPWGRLASGHVRGSFEGGFRGFGFRGGLVSSLGLRIGGQGSGFGGLGFIVESRKLEPHYPHVLKVKYRES